MTHPHLFLPLVSRLQIPESMYNLDADLYDVTFGTVYMEVVYMDFLGVTLCYC